MRILAPVLALAVLAGAYSVGRSRPLLNGQQPTVKRTILQRTDEPGSTTHEAVMAIAEIPPGATTGWHRHPGIELAYVLEGSIVVQMAGHPDTTLVAGNSTRNVGAHNTTNHGTTTARVLAVYLVEKGKPLAEPVPAP